MRVVNLSAAPAWWFPPDAELTFGTIHMVSIASAARFLMPAMSFL